MSRAFVGGAADGRPETSAGRLGLLGPHKVLRSIQVRGLGEASCLVFLVEVPRSSSGLFALDELGRPPL